MDKKIWIELSAALAVIKYSNGDIEFRVMDGDRATFHRLPVAKARELVAFVEVERTSA